jgi:hypothetical protein
MHVMEPTKRIPRKWIAVGAAAAMGVTIGAAAAAPSIMLNDQGQLQPAEFGPINRDGSAASPPVPGADSAVEPASAVSAESAASAHSAASVHSANSAESPDPEPTAQPTKATPEAVPAPAPVRPDSPDSADNPDSPDSADSP